jgi:opacity protein-like surface antigen
VLVVPGLKEEIMVKSKTMLAALLSCGGLGLAAAPAQAQVPGVDFYIGAGIGQSNADIDDVEVTDLDEKDTAWKLFAGARFASVFGAELNYIDFGKATSEEAEAAYKGFAGYGLFYLPLPLPVLDIYAKAGFTRIEVDIDVGDMDSENTKFAYGLGVQLKLGSWAIRGEWERFKVEDSNPSLISVGISKSFL